MSTTCPSITEIPAACGRRLWTAVHFLCFTALVLRTVMEYEKMQENKRSLKDRIRAVEVNNELSNSPENTSTTAALSTAITEEKSSILNEICYQDPNEQKSRLGRPFILDKQSSDIVDKYLASKPLAVENRGNVTPQPHRWLKLMYLK